MTDDVIGENDIVLRVLEPFEVRFFTAMTIPVSDINGWMVRYGQTITVTPSIHFFSKDRNGNSWLDLLEDTDGQVSRYGRVRFARGPWPEELSRVEPGTAEESIAIAHGGICGTSPLRSSAVRDELSYGSFTEDRPN